MGVYFDNCGLQRPLDDKSNLRNRIEAEAVLGIIGLIETGQVDLFASEVNEFELSKTPDSDRIDFGKRVLSLCKEMLPLSDELIVKAKEFEKAGITPIDALHLAVADLHKIDYFCTCDDKLIKGSRGIDDLQTKVVLPTELVRELGL